MSRFIVTLLLGSVLFSSPAAASIMLTEFLADPPDGIAGDANGDGVRSTAGDEFLEFYNSGSEAVDLSGWSVHDAISVRHVFSSGAELPGNSFLVVFGGGTPQIPGVMTQTASTGGLSLNNGGDSILLRDALDNTLFSVTYGGEGGQNASLHRWPTGSEAFVRHNNIVEPGDALFSPGTLPDGSLGAPATSTSAVPEPATALLFGIGGAIAVRRRMR